MYTPLIYKLTTSNNIFDTEPNFITSIYQAQPLFSLGFNYYFHNTKNKLVLLNDPKYVNKKFYNIIHQFEHLINDLDNSIFKSTELYFNAKDNIIPVQTNSFFKLWEILSIFNLIDTDKSINSLHIGDNKAAFLQATLYYREKFYDTKNDSFNIISPNEKNNIIESFKAQNKKKINEAFNNDESDYYINDNIYDTKFIDNIMNKVNNTTFDLITANLSVKQKDINTIEQEYYITFLTQFVIAIKSLKDNGNFVIKIYDSFTNLTIKLINILSQFFKNVYLYKPFTSKQSDSDKYIICLNYTANNKYTNILTKLLTQCIESHNNNKYIVDIFTQFNDNQLNKSIKNINNHLGNLQFIKNNELIVYIQSGNYFGDAYHDYKDKQIEGNSYWIKTFYPLNKNTFNEAKNKFKSIIDKL